MDLDKCPGSHLNLSAHNHKQSFVDLRSTFLTVKRRNQTVKMTLFTFLLLVVAFGIRIGYCLTMPITATSISPLPVAETVTVSASPKTPSLLAPCLTRISLQFDDLPVALLGAGENLSPVPTGYDQLGWSGLNVANLSTPGSLLAPASPDNAAALSYTTENVGTIAAVATTKSFNLYSTFIGCIESGAGVANLPVACTFQFNGTTTAGNLVIETLNYEPNTLLGDGTVSTTVAASMMQKSFPANFQSLVSVVFEVVDTEALSAQGYVDSISVGLNTS